MAKQNNNPQGIWGKVLNIDEEIRKNAKLAMGLVFIVMLGINWMDFGGGFRAINIAITIVGFWKWYETAFKPTHLKYATFAGMAWSVLTLKKPGDGIKEVMTEFGKLVNNVGYIWLLVGFTLSTWSFANNPVAFPIIAVGIIIVTLTGVATGWRAWIISAYAILAITVAIWSTFGDSWNGRSFDPNTGAAMHMVNPETGVVDPLGRTPEYCAAQVDGCFSQTGQKLVPITPEQALSRDVSAWPGLGAETAQNATGLPIWLIVVIVAMLVGGIWMWGGKKTKPVVLAVLLLGAGWAGYTYAWSAPASTSLGCPSTQTIEAYGETFKWKRGCGEQLLRVSRDVNPWYHTQDGRFTGDFNTWATADWDTTDATLVRVNAVRWPDGVNEVEVEVITEAEAARRNRLTADPAPSLVIYVSTNARP